MTTESLVTRAATWNLLCEYTHSDSLRKHALAVEAAMRHYARHFGRRLRCEVRGQRLRTTPDRFARNPPLRAGILARSSRRERDRPVTAQPPRVAIPAWSEVSGGSVR